MARSKRSTRKASKARRSGAMAMPTPESSTEPGPPMPPAADVLVGGGAAASGTDFSSARVGSVGVSAFPPLATALDAKVLVLNKLYMAVRVISARRAFGMLFRELAEVIHIEDGQYMSYDFESWAEISQLQAELEPDQHEWVKTVRFQLAVPRVIRLLGYDRLPRTGVKLNRRNLFARDRNQCQYCGKHFPTSELSIDHVLPRSQGGIDSWDNLVCSCVRCNSRKGGRTPEQASMKLIRPPKEPRSNPLVTVKLGSGRYESWKTFLDNAYWSVELR